MARETSPQVKSSPGPWPPQATPQGLPQLSWAQSSMHFNLAAGGSPRSVPEGISLLASYRPWPHWLQLIGVSSGYPIPSPISDHFAERTCLLRIHMGGGGALKGSFFSPVPEGGWHSVEQRAMQDEPLVNKAGGSQDLGICRAPGYPTSPDHLPCPLPRRGDSCTPRRVRGQVFWSRALRRVGVG